VEIILNGDVIVVEKLIKKEEQIEVNKYNINYYKYIL
jgi:hypothetical protein